MYVCDVLSDESSLISFKLFGHTFETKPCFDWERFGMVFTLANSDTPSKSVQRTCKSDK